MTMMRIVAVLLLVAACKSTAPRTITELADQMCSCKDAACRDDVAAKVQKLMGEMSPEQLEAHVKEVERIDTCTKSIPKETR
jgi:hypothetical protein